ncbi:MAG TPA: hypothetical protein P5277_02250 [Candidatus Paceibacterota bacterium]|nr:hypothetical protein [Candidatus Paceibacterota bacterium]
MNNFIKPSPLKFVIPIAIVLFVITVFIITNNLNSEFSSYNCQIMKLKNYIEGKEISSNVVSFESLNFKTEYDASFIDKLENNKAKINFVSFSNSLLTKINPLYKSTFSFSTSEEDYLCNQINNNQSLDQIKKSRFNGFNYILFLINLIFFFIVGYFISCLLLFFKKSYT